MIVLQVKNWKLQFQMFNKEKFKNNSIYTIPYIVTNKGLLTTPALYSAEIVTVGERKYLRLLYNPSSTAQRYWLYKQSEYEYYFDSKIDVEVNNKVLLEVLYTIPNAKKAEVSCIEQGGFDILTKQNVVDNAIYWGVFCPEVLNQ